MPNPALDAYLARNYLDGAKAEAYLRRSGAKGDGEDGTTKKRRKKRPKEGDHQQQSREATGSGSGFRLVDQSDDTWKRGHGGESDEDEERAMVWRDESQPSSAGPSGSRWSKVGVKADASADRTETRIEERDDLPQVADEKGQSLDSNDQIRAENALLSKESQPPPTARPIRAGLVTRKEMDADRAERRRREDEERATRERQHRRSEADDEEERKRREREREQNQGETVYRDASGRRIDVAEEDAELRRKHDDERRREREKRTWTQGEVQREQQRLARKREEQERTSSFARHATDERMNEALRKVERTNDPAAMFLTRNRQDEQAKQRQRPTYKGPFPPNRFGIRPGYRWDGVERGNGFEAKLFQKRNDRSRLKAEKQAWGQEDM